MKAPIPQLREKGGGPRRSPKREMYARKSNTNRKAQKPENRANLKHENQLGKFSAINDMQVMAPGCNVDHGLLRAISVKAEPGFSLKKLSPKMMN